MQEQTPTTAPVSDDAEKLTLAEDLRQLADEAKTLAQAELAFQKSRAAYAGGESKTIAGLVGMALVLGYFSLVALVVGAVIALTPTLTAWGATAAVTLVLLATAGFCALAAIRKARRVKAVIGGRVHAPEDAS